MKPVRFYTEKEKNELKEIVRITKLTDRTNAIDKFSKTYDRTVIAIKAQLQLLKEQDPTTPVNKLYTPEEKKEILETFINLKGKQRYKEILKIAKRLNKNYNTVSTAGRYWFKKFHPKTSENITTKVHDNFETPKSIFTNRTISIPYHSLEIKDKMLIFHY